MNPITGTKLGWKPAHTLEQGLEKTYQFFKKQKTGLAEARKS